MTLMGAAKEQFLSFGDPAVHLLYFAGLSRGGNYVPAKVIFPSCFINFTP